MVAAALQLRKTKIVYTFIQKEIINCNKRRTQLSLLKPAVLLFSFKHLHCLCPHSHARTHLLKSLKNCEQAVPGNAAALFIIANCSNFGWSPTSVNPHSHARTCLKASKIVSSLSLGMPTPWSTTLMTRCRAPLSGYAFTVTLPCEFNTKLGPS